jgi:fatty acid desaturase
VNARPISHYARLVRPHLPEHAFSAVPSRVAWLTLHVALAALGTWAVARGIGGPWALPFWSLFIGHAFAGCAFVGHETMHGAVIRHKGVRQLIGWVCFLPFTLSPTLWNAWHNKVHHGNTAIDGVDPDMFPTLEVWRKSPTARWAEYFSIGYRRWAGFVTLLMGFTGQSTQMLFVWSRTTDALSAADRRRMWIEAACGWAFWAGIAWLVGWPTFLFTFVCPLIVGNAIVISYILTNHSLSPLNQVNDPLLNSLTVEVSPLVNLLHLNFGLHTEHHLFPSMSSAYAPAVRKVLLERFPDQYQSMPFWKAMRLLARTPRVYQSDTVLLDPLSGFTAPTLLPREAASESDDDLRSAA